MENTAKNNNYKLVIILVISLFFMWALAGSINGVLIKHFRSTLELTRYQAGLIDSAFYFGYFIMALPVGIIVTKIGYRGGIILGLVLFAFGSLLFYPASNLEMYSFFLLAIFIVASGATFLETCANVLITKLGDQHHAAKRLNIAQGFYGFGAVLASYFAATLIFSSGNSDRTVDIPYLIIAGLSVILIVAFIFTKIPHIKSDDKTVIDFRLLSKYPHLRNGVIAQFCYVGIQACIWGYFFYFANSKLHVTDLGATKYFSFMYVLFMVGRFGGAYLLNYINPRQLLGIFAIINVILFVLSGATDGFISIYLLVATNLFMSIMYPTIFILGLQKIEQEAKMAGAFIVMSIIGGSILPPLLGLVADKTGNISYGLIIPIIAQLYIVYYAYIGSKTKH
jgi:FHS family L-fucose permease-like MFS transporter